MYLINIPTCQQSIITLVYYDSLGVFEYHIAFLFKFE